MHSGLHIQSWVWNRIELLGWIEQRGSEFMKAFDESNALIYWRYVDPFWRLKRFLNIGCEATLKRNVKIIDDFVHGVIKTRKAQLALQQESVSRSVASVPPSISFCFI